ncbi:MAG: ATP-binding protein [Pseudanabaenaceae cyanobacterium]
MATAPSNKVKVLVVDDEINNLDLLERTLRQEYQVFRASSALEALRILQNEPNIAVVIADQRMPQMTGTDFLYQVARQHPRTVRVILTAHADVQDLVEAINSAKVFKYLTKPFRREELLDIVEQAVRQYSANTQPAATYTKTNQWLFDTALEGIFQTDVLGRFHTANSMLAEIFGINSVDELIDHYSKTDFYVDPNRHQQFVELFRTTDLVTNFESQVYRCDRTKIWISENVRAIRTESGELIGFEGTIQDITARKRAEEESSLLQNLTFAISMAKDFHSALQIALQKICDFTGWELGEAWVPNVERQVLQCSTIHYTELAGIESFREVTLCAKLPLDSGFLGSVWQSRRSEWIWDITRENTLILARRDLALELGMRAKLAIPIIADEEIVAIMCFFMRAPKEEDRRLLGLVSAIATQLGTLMQRRRDEEAIRTMNEELARARDAALEASRAKSTFVANMSHELRTPLNAILGYSQMLIEDATELGLTQFVEDLQKIQSSGKHLLSIINDILDLSKIEAGKMEIYPEEFAVGRVVRDVTDALEPLLQRNNNTLLLDCPDTIGTMYTDQMRLRQCLWNLLGNACKFTQDGIVTLRVVPVNHQGEPWLDFIVSDTGIGMTEEQLGKLFTIFSQGDSSTTRKYGGTGLGLAITKRLCQIMGGRISVQSELGVGSTFTLSLPVRLTEAKNDPLISVLLDVSPTQSF